jgi:hypothetical protein
VKSLKKKLNIKVEVRDYKGIPPLIQEDISIRKY